MIAIPTRPALLLLVAASAAAWVAGVPPARAQAESREGIALQNQILELRRDLEAQRAQNGGGGPAYTPPPNVGGGDLAANLLTRVTQLEDEVRRLRGQLDEEQNARTRQGEDLNKQIGDLGFKLGSGNGAAPTPPPLATPRYNSGDATPPPRPAPVVRRRTPEVALAEGTAAYNRHDFTTAQAAAREVLADGGPRAGDAQFLLARSLAGARNYQAAAVAYDDSYKRNPKGSRAQDSLVGLANTLADLNERKAACETLDKARAEFPTPRPDVRPALTAARFRAGCGA